MSQTTQPIKPGIASPKSPPRIRIPSEEETTLTDFDTIFSPGVDTPGHKIGSIRRGELEVDQYQAPAPGPVSQSPTAKHPGCLPCLRG